MSRCSTARSRQGDARLKYRILTKAWGTCRVQASGMTAWPVRARARTGTKAVNSRSPGTHDGTLTTRGLDRPTPVIPDLPPYLSFAATTGQSIDRSARGRRSPREPLTFWTPMAVYGVARRANGGLNMKLPAATSASHGLRGVTRERVSAPSLGMIQASSTSGRPTDPRGRRALQAKQKVAPGRTGVAARISRRIRPMQVGVGTYLSDAFPVHDGIREGRQRGHFSIRRTHGVSATAYQLGTGGGPLTRGAIGRGGGSPPGRLVKEVWNVPSETSAGSPCSRCCLAAPGSRPRTHTMHTLKRHTRMRRRRAVRASASHGPSDSGRISASACSFPRTPRSIAAALNLYVDDSSVEFKDSARPRSFAPSRANSSSAPKVASPWGWTCPSRRHRLPTSRPISHLPLDWTSTETTSSLRRGPGDYNRAPQLRPPVLRR